MKNCILLLIMVLGMSIGYSQVTIKTGTYLYANDVALYTKGDIDFQGNATLYLREEAQLVQGSNSVQNEGTGGISVFQEGTESSYNYNYWGSPVGNNTAATAGNLGFRPINHFYYDITTTDATVTGVGLDRVDSGQATVLGVGPSGWDGTTDDGSLGTPLHISDRWIWKYTTGANNYGSWEYVGSNSSTVPAGYGFTMKGVSGTGPNYQNFNGRVGQRYDFRGRPNTGTFSIPVTGTGTTVENFVLVGNPYPSSFNLQQFLIDNGVTNNNIEAIAYFWDSDPNVSTHLLDEYRGGYGTYVPNGGPGGIGIYSPATFVDYDNSGSVSSPANLGTGATIPRQFIPIGQGFMIARSDAGTGNAVINNSYRSVRKEGLALNNQFQSAPGSSFTTNNTPVVSFLRLNTVRENGSIRQLYLGFDNNATLGVDRGWDGQSPTTNTVDAYWYMNNDSFVINQTNFDVSYRLPIGIKAINANESIEFKIQEDQNLPTSEVYIYDATYNTYNDITNGNSYVAYMNAGTDNGRFEMVFADDSTLDSGEETMASFDVFQNNTQEQLTILNPQGQDIAAISIYDTAGRLILGNVAKGTATEFTIATGGWSDGIYIVQILTTDNVRTARRVGVHNKQ